MCAIKGGRVGRLMANTILNFHFDYPLPSLMMNLIQEEEYERGHWGSKAEFLLSCIGYSVGIGWLSPLSPSPLSSSWSSHSSSPLSSLWCHNQAISGYSVGIGWLSPPPSLLSLYENYHNHYNHHHLYLYDMYLLYRLLCGDRLTITTIIWITTIITFITIITTFIITMIVS